MALTWLDVVLRFQGLLLFQNHRQILVCLIDDIHLEEPLLGSAMLEIELGNVLNLLSISEIDVLINERNLSQKLRISEADIACLKLL